METAPQNIESPPVHLTKEEADWAKQLCVNMVSGETKGKWVDDQGNTFGFTIETDPEQNLFSRGLRGHKHIHILSVRGAGDYEVTSFEVATSRKHQPRLAVRTQTGPGGLGDPRYNQPEDIALFIGYCEQIENGRRIRNADLLAAAEETVDAWSPGEIEQIGKLAIPAALAEESNG